MDETQRVALVERYGRGTAAVKEALDGISEAELDARPAPGEWTAREIVHHLADGEMRAATRLRQLIAEDAPVIQGYDQDVYAKSLHYGRPLKNAIAVIAAARNASAELLAVLTDAEWGRSGTHTESGPYSVDDWLEIYTAHPFDHAEQIRRARASAG
jgi:hypothetical protein